MTHFNKGPSYGLSAEVKNKLDPGFSSRSAVQMNNFTALSSGNLSEEGDEWHGIAGITYHCFMNIKAEVEH